MAEQIKRLILSVCVLAVVIFSFTTVAAVIRKERQAEAQPVLAAAEKSDALAEFALEREQLRSMQLAGLDELINSEKSSPSIIESAQQEKLEIMRRLETEQTVSGILRARGFSDAVAAASGGHVTVMVRAAQAGESDIPRIMELVVSETGLNAGNIKIIPIN